jgi:hypothetical protein
VAKLLIIGEFVHQYERLQNIASIHLRDIPVCYHLVEDKVGFLYIEHYIQFTHIFEVLIKCLYQRVNKLQISHFVILGFIINPHYEIQRSISSINDLVIPVLKKRAVVIVSRETSPNELTLQRNPLFYCEEFIVLRKAGLALFVHHKYELDHPGKFSMFVLRRFGMFCESAGTGKNRLLGFRPFTERMEDQSDMRSISPPRKLQSRWVRKRVRRNVTQRIYGSSYDHGMDDYR